MAFTQYKRKLYFNLTWAGGATTGPGSPLTKFIPITPFRTSATFGDRYGSLLQPLAALTGNSPNNEKAGQAVTAYFQAFGTTGPGGAVALTSGVDLAFVAPTFAVSGNTDLVPLLPYLSADGTSVARNKGKDTIYGTLGQPRHFSVRARRTGTAALSASLSGVLYVSRQHSIEV